jgi:tetratricopeptide (TPR) repeat protein
MLTLLSFLFILIPSTYLYSQDETAYDNYLRQANELIIQGDSTSNETAKQLFLQALTLNPDGAEALNGLGSTFLRGYYLFNHPETSLDSSIYYYRKTLEIDPHYVDAWINLLSAYRINWNHSLSRMILLEALHYNPDEPELLALMGRNYFDTGNPGLALPYLLKSIEAGPPDYAYRFAGWCWFYLEQHDKQLEYFSRFRELDRNSLMGIAGYIHSYTGMKDYPNAIQTAQQMLDENPNHQNRAWILAYVAETNLFAGNYDDEKKYYEMALTENKNADNLYATRSSTTTLAFLYRNEERIAESDSLLAISLERRLKDQKNGPERWEFSHDIASVYAVKGERENAFKWLYTSILTGFPGHLWYQDPLFEAYREDSSFIGLIQQARKRVLAEYND